MPSRKKKKYVPMDRQVYPTPSWMKPLAKRPETTAPPASCDHTGSERMTHASAMYSASA